MAVSDLLEDAEGGTYVEYGEILEEDPDIGLKALENGTLRSTAVGPDELVIDRDWYEEIINQSEKSLGMQDIINTLTLDSYDKGHNKARGTASRYDPEPDRNLLKDKGERNDRLRKASLGIGALSTLASISGSSVNLIDFLDMTGIADTEDYWSFFKNMMDFGVAGVGFAGSSYFDGKSDVYSDAGAQGLNEAYGERRIIIGP